MNQSLLRNSGSSLLVVNIGIAAINYFYE